MKEKTMRFIDKVVVITGGGSGIGAATARRFHQEGASVVIADRSADRGEKFAAELGDGRAYYRNVDVADWVEVKDLIEGSCPVGSA